MSHIYFHYPHMFRNRAETVRLRPTCLRAAHNVPKRPVSYSNQLLFKSVEVDELPTFLLQRFVRLNRTLVYKLRSQLGRFGRLEPRRHTSSFGENETDGLSPFWYS